MKKLNYIILTVLVLSLIITVQGTPETKGERGKTMQIGKMSWYTEHNTFDDIVKIAKKENKPILAVFSATWCKPCQHVKKYVLAKDEFKKVADKMVLLYIEQTDPKAAAYINKFKVMSYPTFTFFTKEGKELETGHPERTVDGFLKWIDDINSGNSFYELSEKLKEEPGNRKIMMKLAGKMGWQQRDEVVKLARKVIELNPDFNDPISKKAYLEILRNFSINLNMERDKKARMDYAKKYNGEFMKIFNTYYGDKPPYMLKDWDGLGQIINWLNILEKYKDALAYFDNYSKTRENNIAFEKNMGIFPGILTSLLYSGREKEAEAWITTLQKQAEETLGKMDKDEKEMNKMQYTYFFNSNYRTLADYYNKKGDQKKAEKYSQLISWN